jgi:glycosyltransferase involved in cell wall biosynthesis
MRRGVAVACANASALPEVAGDAAELFAPLDEASIAAALLRVIEKPERRAELVARGHRRAPQFTWERTARGTLDVYERVLGAQAGRTASASS